MEYYETLESPAKRRKLSGRNRSYSRISVNKQTVSDFHMQKSSLLSYNNKKNIKNNKHLEFVTSTPLKQVVKEKEAIQHPSSETKINTENFLPLIDGSQEKGIIDNLEIQAVTTKSVLLETGTGNFTTKTRSTKNVLYTIEASLPHRENKNSFKINNAIDKLDNSVRLSSSLDSDEEEESLFWTRMKKSSTNAKLHSDKDKISAEGNVEVLFDTVKRTNIVLTSNKTDITIAPKISLEEEKLIKPFNKSKIPMLLNKKLMNQKKPATLSKELLVQDHNFNIPKTSVAEKQAVENLSKVDNLVLNVDIAAAKVQKNAEIGTHSESNISKIPQKIKQNVSKKQTKSKVSFMNPLVSSNGSKPHITREIKILLDQNKMFGSDFMNDLVVESELSRRSSLRKVKETSESLQIYSNYTKDEKNVKSKRHKQSKILKPAIAPAKPIELMNNNQNNDSTKHVIESISNAIVTDNKASIFTKQKSRSTKKKANIVVKKTQEGQDSSTEDENIFESQIVRPYNNDPTKYVIESTTNAIVTDNKTSISTKQKSRSTKKKANIVVKKTQEGQDSSTEDENIFESQILPNEKVIKKVRYTKKLKNQTDKLLSDKSEANVNDNNAENIEKSNSSTQIKHAGTAVPLESNVIKNNYTKDSATSMLKESNIKNGIIKLKTKGQSWSPGLKHELLNSGLNTPVMGVRMMVDVPYNGKTIQLECMADYALICSNYKPIPGTKGNVVYGNGLHTAMNDICSGNIEMNPNSSKGIQTPKRHHLIFCVMTGTVLFTIRHARKRVNTGAHFFVPCGISYNIENIGTEKAVLSFFKITRGRIALDRSA